ncbi:aconitase/3-isopropylmalate dehydratase large subunit family protein, partial [Chloroflexota bacterium]
GDHTGCHVGSQWAPALKLTRDLAKRYGIEKFYDVNTGVQHVVVPEEGIVRPGMLVCGKDSHATACGALNAFATGIGPIETAWIYATGELWFQVPETIKMICSGKLGDGIEAKDVFLYVVGKYSESMAQYKSLEWKGPVIDAMEMFGRLTLSVQSLELGAKCSPFEPDAKCMEFLTATPHGRETSWPTPADPDAVYEKVYEEDFSRLEPQVALPHGFDVVKPVSEVEGVKVDQCNMGSCSNGRYEDLVIAARIFKGRKVKARTLMSPGSWRVYRKALETGVLQTLTDAGVLILAPACSTCGYNGGCISDSEVAIGSTTRNMRGRYGSMNAQIYLASTATTAASAVMGQITDPRKLL